LLFLALPSPRRLLETKRVKQVSAGVIKVVDRLEY
jgi:hypothetical protein